MKKFYITTPIYYASGKPHIGHSYTTIWADVLARYKKEIGYDVFFLTGTDEHGQKILDTAEKQNIPVQEMLDNISDQFKKLWKELDINYSKFVRTTDKQHCETVQKAFTKLLERDYIYKGTWTGLYCVNCEENYTRDQAVEKDGKLYCKVGHPLTTKDESSYFLKVGEFAEWVKIQYQLPYFILPNSRINELRGSFIDKGLEDLSVSRSSLKWGVPVPNDPKHVVYVWLDALLAYLSGLGYLSNDDANFQKYWQDNETDIVHLMSKEITRFHCIYWPILLNMLDLRLPSNIISHGWVVTKEGKMSKSLGNIVDPMDYVKEFGSDAFRYYIVRQVSLEKDGVFSRDLFIETYNTQLANNYGNMATRVAGMIKKYFNNVVSTYSEKDLTALDKEVIEKEKKVLSTVEKKVDDYFINSLIDDIQGQYDVLNKYIEDSKPWALAKDPAKKAQLSNCLNILFNGMVNLMILLSPILVKTTANIEKSLGIKLTSKNLSKNWQGTKIGDLAPIFVRVEKK